MLISAPDKGYTVHLCKYIFQSDSIETFVIEDDSDMDSINTRWILIYDEQNEIIKSWIMSHYPEQAGSRAIITQ